MSTFGRRYVQRFGSRIVFAVLVLACGCATHQFVPAPQLDVPPAGRAVIRVLRPSICMWGSARVVTVRDDQTTIGELGPGGELVWERPAGSMILSLAPAFMIVSADSPPVVAEIEAGKTYTYSIVVKDSYFALAQ